ncbi:MAG: NAD(P)H-hydrate dehydratase [Candidatus Pacebacteria bacterium RIFCSPHIGHO2_01_FULL_46_10]|nr:MAG: NAD(P)H-hydrate dehydratase [Candidatus Pacebacteria bacterium RIFCSPHIGHO2_01_FULL_46_10]
MNAMNINTYLKQIRLPQKNSHKGENGRLLIIGGSDLFHAASAWSLDIATKIVDMVFYSSTPENNANLKEAKKKFWDGVVVPRGKVEAYIEEADCVLIGPGMTRDDETAQLTNALLKKYQQKKWVIDAGALQMVDVSLLNEHMIVTPHHKEYERVFGKSAKNGNEVCEDSRKYHNVCIVLKGQHDVVAMGEQREEIDGGNEGMTKGGTGDVLAGLIAALYCTNDAFPSAVVGSYLNKTAGDVLYKKVGPFFNSSDVVHQLPETMKSVFFS